MKWFILLVGVVVVCFVVALLLTLVGGGLGRAGPSLSHEPLPDDELTDADFDELSFDLAVRGYRMSQVDGVVDRLRRELREKDEQIAVLRGEPVSRGRDGTTTDPPVQLEGGTPIGPVAEIEIGAGADPAESEAPVAELPHREPSA